LFIFYEIYLKRLAFDENHLYLCGKYCDMADEITQNPTREIQKELPYIKWLTRIVERLTLNLVAIKDRQDKIQETDYEIHRFMHRAWFDGEFPIYETINIPDKTKATQPSLFSDKSTDTSCNFDDARDKILDGTVCGDKVSEPIK
jgi:hypothetical protein